MTRFSIHTEWEDPKRAKGSELSATWASLRIEAGHEGEESVVSRYYDHDFNTVKNQVYGPLYPLAEWVAFNWFHLLYGTSRTAERKQDLRFGAEGFALPKLRFVPEGESVRLAWFPYHHDAARVDFLAHGESVVPRDRVELELSNFLNRVVGRLEEKGIRNSPLQAEWKAILELEDEERIFCQAAAALGLEPFSMEEELEDQILKAASLVGPELLEEFFPAADTHGLIEKAEAIASAMKTIEIGRNENSSLEKLRLRLNGLEASPLAWERGYELAKCVRSQLNLEGAAVSEALLREFVNPEELGLLDAIPRIDGLVSRNCSAVGSAVSSVLLTRRPETAKFALARILCESLRLAESRSTLVTKERTDRQKLSRAFAAEFLAPAEEIGRRLPGRVIYRDNVDELAGEFEVSALVIENQIKNHGLGWIED